jgi:hypothetical protein
VEACAGVKADSLWSKILPVFAQVKGEMKFAADRKQETVDYRLKRLPDLVQLANRLVDFCSETLRNLETREWLFVLEDFDRSGISGGQLQDVFIQYGTVFQDLRANLLFTIPVWLGYSADTARLPFPKTLIPDTPVFDRYHGPHREGRKAVHKVLCARISDGVMDSEQMERLIVASGGNIRDLFAMVSHGVERALLRDREAQAIGPDDVTRAIAAMRAEYRNRLGESPHDPKPVHWEEKAAKLLAVYRGEAGSDIPDPILYSLLRARAVQEFNGERWFGVHPLVVDILKVQGKLNEGELGGTT